MPKGYCHAQNFQIFCTRNWGSSSQILRQRVLDIRRQPVVDQAHNLSTVPLIRLLQVLTHPSLDIRNLWVLVLGLLFASVELCETDAESNLVHICIRDGVICSGGDWRIDEKLKKALSRKAPALGIPRQKGFGVCEGLGVGDNCEFTVGWA